MILNQAIKQSNWSLRLRVPVGPPRQVLESLVAALQRRDAETYEHSERVIGFSLRLARELSLDEVQTKSLELGALLHDIGKIRGAG